MIHQTCQPFSFFNYSVIQNLITDIFKYTSRLCFEILKNFVLLRKCLVEVQTSVIQITLSPLLKLFSGTFSKILDVLK